MSIWDDTLAPTPTAELRFVDARMMFYPVLCRGLPPMVPMRRAAPLRAKAVVK